MTCIIFLSPRKFLFSFKFSLFTNKHVFKSPAWNLVNEILQVSDKVDLSPKQTIVLVILLILLNILHGISFKCLNFRR